MIWMMLMAWSLSVMGQCIDFYDLNASYVKCEIGPYTARTGGASWTTQKVDYGPGEMQSRHTVHLSSTEIDPRTTNNGTTTGLHTVPAGENGSVRLGNWLDGRVTGNSDDMGQAERITYTFTVTEESKYLLMRYAIVWQDPHNHSDLVPSFQLETFLGATGNTLIDGACYNFDYDANSTGIDYTGEWSTSCRVCTSQDWWGNCTAFTWRHEDQVIAWRDWRTRIINLEDYVGQTVRLRFTSSDCGYVEHWGYAYFTLRCLEANLYSPTCGGPTETRVLEAPSGLDYIWYKVKDDHTGRVLIPGEENNTLTVLNDGQTYECYVASPENASCHISLYAKAEPYAPLADFQIDKHQACVDTVYLIDKSGITRNGVTPVTPHVDVDYVTFDYGDGVNTDVRYYPGETITPFVYEQDGTYTITQTAHIVTFGTCTHSISKTVTVRGSETRHEGHEYVSICAGDTCYWKNGKYAVEGNYPHVMVNAAANNYCDSTVWLHLTVNDTYYNNATIDVLEGRETPYVWHGHLYNTEERKFYQSGVYWDSCHSIHGCDSVYRLDLRVHPKYLVHRYDTICSETDFSFGSKTYNFRTAKDTICYDSLLTHNWSNDSVIRLYLHVVPTRHYSESRNFCKGDTITFHGERFWTDGPHTVTFTTPRGCDSTFTLILHQLPTYLKDSFITITDQQTPFLFGINPQKACHTTGIYFDSLQTVAGCDSVVRLHLTVNPTYSFYDADTTICEGQSYDFHGTLLTATGSYTKTFHSIYGTDSTYHINLTVKPRFNTFRHVDKREGEEYDFFGTKLTTGGVYYYTFTENARRCDSVITLELEFHPQYFYPVYDTICKGESYHFHKNGTDIYYDTPGTYWDSLKTIHNYDSVFRLQLFVASKDTVRKKETICHPATYDFFGQTLDASGIYYKTLTSRYGCDSVVELTLTVNPDYHIYIDSTICEGESVVFAGESRSTSGIYTHSYLTRNGCNCDSVVTLTLTVVPKARIHENIHLCTGQSFSWKGELITSNRVVSDTTPSLVTGCDSIHFYHIYAHEAIRDTLRRTVCLGGSYTFHGHTYTPDHAGNDTITLGGTSINGCDSLHTLILTANPTYYNQHIYDTICTGDYVTFNSKDYDEGGIYYDTLKTENCGCDSAFIIHVKAYPRYFSSSTVRLCEDSSLVWHGQTITGPGTYYDSLTSVLSHNRCDSVYELKVLPQATVGQTIQATILNTQSYSFAGKALNTSGFYYDTLPSVRTGCDSIVTLELTVKQVYTTNVIDTICRGEKYHINGKELENGGLYIEKFISTVYGTDSTVNLTLVVWEPRIKSSIAHITDQQLPYAWTLHDNSIRMLDHGGVYDDSLQSIVTGCDSINRLQLVVHPTVREEKDTAICAERSYYWHNQTCSATGDYYDTLRNAQWPQLDSVYYHLHLTVNDIYRTKDTVYLCEGEHFTFNHKDRSSAGTYYDTLKTTCCGCDSSFILTVKIRNTTTRATAVTICPSELPYTWHTWRDIDRTYDAGGNYLDTLRTKDDLCDSIYYTLALTVKPAYDVTLPEATICDNKWYNFCGRLVNQPGDYDTTLTAFNGCDSIVRVHLNVNPTYVNDTSFILCTGDNITFNHRVYTHGNTYIDTLHTQNGCNCDSIYDITIHEVHPFYHTETYSLCKDSTMEWHNQTITGPGTYYDSHKSKASNLQCDSVYELKVTAQEPSFTQITRTTWSNNPFYFNGRQMSTSGIYYDTLPAAGNKCDSIVELTLTVLDVYDVTVYDTICRGETYDFHGMILENGGRYSTTIPSSIGTDSTITLALLVWEPRIKSSIKHITDRQLPYTWTLPNPDRSYTLTHGGVYDDTIHNGAVTGCDSINRLQLVVHQTVCEEKDTAICAERSYYWHNQTCSATGDYYDTLRNAQWPRLDSIYYELHLTVNDVYRTSKTVYICEGDHYTFNNKDFTSANTYYDTLKTENCGCDSSFIHYVKVRTPSTRVTAVTICPSELPYTWHTWRDIDRTYDAGGNYLDTLRTKDDLCDSIYYTLSLTVKPAYDVTLPEATICDNKSYNFCGRLINQPGDYDTTLTAFNGCDSIVRVHLNVNPTYHKDTSFILCTGDNLTFNHRVYTHGNTYIDTLHTQNGCNCDSIYDITIHEVHPFYHTETYSLCKDSTMEWHNQTITGPGTYYDSHKSKASNLQCDSVYELKVTAQEPSFTQITRTTWSNNPFYFNGRQMSTSGIYYDTLPAAGNKCDSIVELTLTVLDVYDVSYTAEICRGDVYTFNGNELTEPNLYRDTLLSRYFTDSIVNLTLVVHNPRLFTYDRHISDKQSYLWQKHNGDELALTHTGVYDDTIHGGASTGCDSICRLNLYVHQTYDFHEDGATCKGTAYYWRGNPYYEAGEYKDEFLTSGWPVDSIYHLHLRVDSVYHHDTVVYICEGDAYNFQDSLIFTSGTYDKKLKTRYTQCDSTFRVTVHVRQTRTYPEAQYICQGEAYPWRGGRVLTERGIYYDTIRTKDGLCDSIYYSLDLRLKDRYERDVHATICEGDYYDFLGRSLNIAGDYDTTLQAYNYCDSVIHLHLKVNPTYDIDIYDTICEGSARWFNNIERRESGLYTYRGQTKAGCDSIVTLHLSVIAKQTAYIEHHLCVGDFVEIDGQRVTTSGTYPVYSTSSRGCDSTTIWRVITHLPLRDTSRVAICKGKEYIFHGIPYRDPGTYSLIDKSRYGCDSNYVLVLTVNPVYQRDTTLEICEGEYFTYNGHRYDVGGSYQDTARTKNGCNCDSILNITLTKHPVTIIPMKADICHGDVYTWHNRKLTRAGVYDDTIHMKTRACDSIIYRLTLNVNSDYYEEFSTAICDNSTYLFRGHTYTKTGVYYDSLVTVNSACDSVFCLKLTVNPTYRNVETVMRCDIEPYWYNGHWLTQTGEYTQKYQTACGCDSTEVLRLTVTPTRRDTQRVTICEGQSYIFYGREIAQSGIYYDTVDVPYARQCVITVLDLGFQKPTVISNVRMDDVCADDDIWSLRTHFTGSRPDVFTLLFDDNARAAGFSNIISQPYEDEITGRIPRKQNGDYIRPDYYSAQLILDNDVCASAGGEKYDIRFVVRYPSWIIEQNWNDVVALLNENYNGGYQFSAYEWVVNDSPTGYTRSNLFLPEALGSGDEVSVLLTRVGEDYAVPSCPITIYDKTPELVSTYPVLAHPTSIRGQLMISADADGEYQLFSTTGQLITSGTYRNGQQLLVQTNGAEACYILRLSTPSHGVQTKKMIIH